MTALPLPLPLPPTTSSPDPDRAGPLLRSVVDVARAIFGAQASSVLLHDAATDDLVFRAVSGRGEEFLVGTRFPAHRGIAGFVLMSAEPMIVDDLEHDPTFARDVAEETRYLPRSLMAAPLLSQDRVLGVLEVLDPVPSGRATIGELDLLSMFATQAAHALHAAGAVREPDQAGLSEVIGAVRAMSAGNRRAGLRLVEALRAVLTDQV